MSLSAPDMPSGDVNVSVSAPDVPSVDVDASVSVPDVPSVDVKTPKTNLFGKFLKKKPSKASVEVSPASPTRSAFVIAVALVFLFAKPAVETDLQTFLLCWEVLEKAEKMTDNIFLRGSRCFLFPNNAHR